MKVVNLFAAPGTGKTATSQILAGMLSIANYRVECIPEFAKFATFAKNQAALTDQIYMFAKQENRLHVLKGAQLDFVVMDGPLPIALLFQPDNYFKAYETLVMEVFGSFDNHNFFLEKNPELAYKQHGRNETEPESLMLQDKLKGLLTRHGVPFTTHRVTPELPAELFAELTGRAAPLAAR